MTIPSEIRQTSNASCPIAISFRCGLDVWAQLSCPTTGSTKNAGVSVGKSPKLH